MKYSIVPVTPLMQNCSLIWCEETMKGAAVDPGGDMDAILERADEKGIELEKILVTHGHMDHAGSVAELAEARGLTVEGPHPDDRFWIDGMPQQAVMFGLPEARVFTPIAGWPAAIRSPWVKPASRFFIVPATRRVM